MHESQTTQTTYQKCDIHQIILLLFGSNFFRDLPFPGVPTDRSCCEELVCVTAHTSLMTDFMYHLSTSLREGQNYLGKSRWHPKNYFNFNFGISSVANRVKGCLFFHHTLLHYTLQLLSGNGLNELALRIVAVFSPLRNVYRYL